MEQYIDLSKVWLPTPEDVKKSNQAVYKNEACELNFTVIANPICIRYTHQDVIRVAEFQGSWATTIGTWHTVEQVVETFVQMHPTAPTCILAYPNTDYVWVVVECTYRKKVAAQDKLPYKGLEKLLKQHRAVLVKH